METELLFEYDINSMVGVKKLDFNHAPMGRYPYGSLMLAANNKMYGLTCSGGSSSGNGGVLFEYDLMTYTYSIKYDFGQNTYKWI